MFFGTPYTYIDVPIEVCTGFTAENCRDNNKCYKLHFLQDVGNKQTQKFINLIKFIYFVAMCFKGALLFNFVILFFYKRFRNSDFDQW